MIAFVCMLFATSCARAIGVRSAAAPGVAGNPREQQMAVDILDRINAERSARGLAPLALDANLSIGAYGWSQTMAAQNNMHHSDLLAWIRPFLAVGENIAWETSPGMTSGDMHRMWMQSDPHRHNVLAPNLTHVGIGVVCAGGKMWGTERFGSVSSVDFGGMPPVNPIVRADSGTLSC